MVRVKICGITNVRDARMAARLGADALGFNFYKGSQRYIKPERAKAIIASLPPFITNVGVFVDAAPEEIIEIVRLAGLDAVQFHGDERPSEVHSINGVRRIKAIRVQDARDIARCRRYRVEAYLLDAYVPDKPGGTGEKFNWELAREAGEFGPIILAGGLNPANVADAIEIAQPYAVDVASGVEIDPGKKDATLVEAFIQEARAASDS